MKSQPTTVLRAAAWLLILTYVILGAAAVRTATDATLLALGLFAFCAAILPGLVRKDYELLEPPTVLAALVFVCVNVKLAYILWFRGKSDNVDERLLLGQDASVLIYGCVVVAVGLLLFSLGYLVRVRVPSRWITLPERTEWKRDRVLIVCGGLILVATVFFVLFGLSAGISLSSAEGFSQKRFPKAGVGSAERIHSLAYYYYRIAALSKLVFVLILAWMLKTKRSMLSLEGTILFVSGAQAFALCVAVSNRAGVVLLLLDATVLWFMFRRSIDLVRIGVLGLTVLIAIIGLLKVRAQSDHTTFELVEKTITGRDLMDISKTCHIINAVPRTIDYRYGETLIGWTVAPIPRSMWRGKPMWAERGVYLTRYIYGDRFGFTGMPPGLIAELYWNLGWFGVVPGMLLAGLAWRSIYGALQSNATNPNAIVLYVLIVNRALIFTFGLDLGSGILKAGLDVVPFLAIVFFIAPVPSAFLAPRMRLQEAGA